MSNILALTRNEHPRQSGESQQAYEDRTLVDVYCALVEKDLRTGAEEKELQSLFKEMTALAVAKGGYLPRLSADAELQPTMDRLRKELEKDFAPLTPLKILLVDQLLMAVSDAASYGKMFSVTRYKTEGSRIEWNDSPDNIRLLAEVRKGKDSAAERILRFSQALRDLTRPPIQVKATNAFFAQNQQINQDSAKDLEKSSTMEDYAKAHS